jgi:phosphoribosylamine--glycine ligase
MASNGYPQKYQSGFELSIPADIAKNVYVAGAKLDNNVLKTAGGRVLGATATADTLPEAITAAYKLVDKIHFDNAYYRHDIGARAMRALKED